MPDEPRQEVELQTQLLRYRACLVDRETRLPTLPVMLSWSSILVIILHLVRISSKLQGYKHLHLADLVQLEVTALPCFRALSLLARLIS